MTKERRSAADDESLPSDRVAGVAIAAGSLLSLLFMLHHPQANASETAELVDRVLHIQGENAVVHGSLIAILGVLLAGFSRLAARLGGSRFDVCLGLVAYGTGTMALIAAGLVNGFVVPEFVSRYQGYSPEALETVRHILALCRAANQVCTRVGLLAVAAGMLLWSLRLVRSLGFSRGVGVLGCVTAPALVVGLLSGRLLLDVHGLLAFLLAQSVWNLGVSAGLISKRI
jgi:hypothetical protein